MPGDPRKNIGETISKAVLLISAIFTIIGIIFQISVFSDPSARNFALGFMIALGLAILTQAVWKAIADNRQTVPSPSSSLKPAVKDLDQSTNETTYNHYSKNYGLAHEYLKISATLQDDGSMIVKRESKTVAFLSGIRSIDHYLLSDAKSGNINVEDVRCLSDPLKNLSQRTLRATSQGLTLTIDIDPPLTEGEAVEIRVIEKTPPGAISTTYEEMLSRKKDFQYECFFWDITRPVKHLDLRIFVPDSLSPTDAGADVWLGPSRVSCLQELPRVEKSFKRNSDAPGHSELNLSISYPLPGLIYAVKWIPIGNHN